MRHRGPYHGPVEYLERLIGARAHPIRRALEGKVVGQVGKVPLQPSVASQPCAWRELECLRSLAATPAEGSSGVAFVGASSPIVLPSR